MTGDDWNAAYDAGVFATQKKYENENTGLRMEIAQLRAALENSQSLLDRVYEEDSIISSGDLHTVYAQNKQALAATAPTPDETNPPPTGERRKR